MDIKAEMEVREKRFEDFGSEVLARQNKITAIQNEANTSIQSINDEIVVIADEMKRVQGEYRLLAQMQEELEAPSKEAEGKFEALTEAEHELIASNNSGQPVLD